MTIPFICVFIAFLMIYLAKAPVVVAMKRESSYDNKHPRAQQARLTGWGARAYAAHQNAFEAFAPFAAAVVVAHLGGGDAKTCSAMAITFVAARVLYNVLYIADVATLRSVIWGVGFFCTAGLFISPWL